MKSWKLKEVVLMSSLGVVFAFVYLAFFLFGQGLRNLLLPIGLAPFAYEIIFGIWFIVSIIAAYIIRRPGAAFFSELIAGIVQVLVGSPAGPMLILTAAIQGLGAEAVFAAFRWRVYTLPVLMAAGAGAAVVSYAYHLFASGYIALGPGLIISMFIVRVLSGILLAGLLGKWLSDRLEATGVLRGYAIHHARTQRSSRHAS
ncbi:ECF transporter S component [Alkalicoccus urumqiensis]|uniref:Thiamine permease n=1 Tax=Alkalicoccus urumqiensis TaxID=1548213 RepID=A0A2P6MIX9_ALKUR|nr:ECF transporter S component [Alkalicoccus urumqiensis]PRO66239.1 thiamine permease [Alkalicoccus urumqiensis]